MSLAQDDLFSVILQLQHLAGGERSNAALYIGRSLVDEDNGAICLLEDTSAGIKKSSICSNFQDCKRVCAVLDTTNGRTNIIALGTKGEIAWVQGPSFAESTLLGQSYLPNPSFLLYCQNTTVIGGVDSCIELISSVDGGRMVIDLEGPTCICAMANSSDHLFYTTMAKPSSDHRTAKFGWFNVKTQLSQETDLPKNFLQPNQLVVIPQEDIVIIYNGPAYVLAQIGSEGSISFSQVTNYCSPSRASGPLLLIESVSNIVSITRDRNDMESSANVPSQHFFCISLNNGDLFMQRFCDGRLELVAQTSSVPFSSMVLCERDKGSGNFFVTGASLANGLMQINIRVAGTSPTVAPLGNSSKSTFVTDTTTVGESIYLCYGLGEAARLGTFEENIPLSIDYRSDPIFRGSTGIWMLKQYGMDRHHSMLAVSFVCSTILLQIELTGDSMTMTDLSEFYGIDTHRRTLAIENATNGSFLIQVCPNRVLVFKSNSSREQAGEVIAEWSPEHDESTPMVDTDISFSSAQIINDHTFALETRNRQFFIFQCKTGRGAASITKLTSFLIPAETTAFAIYPLHEAGSGSLSPRAAAVARSEYILACASLTSLTFWKIHIEENGQRIDELHTMPSSTSSPVNEMKFVRGPSREARLHLGCRDGSLLVMRVTSQDQQSIACEEIYIATVGKRPVQLVPLSLPKEQRAMLILSGGAMLLSEDEQFNLELVMPKADHLVRWVYQQSSGARREDGDDFSSEGCAGIRFVAIAHETLLIGHSTLKATRRIVPRQALPNARHLLVSGNYLICVASPFRSLLDSPMGMRGAALPPEVVVYHRSPSGGVEDEFILHRSVLAAGDLVMSACIVSNVGGSSGSINESTAVTIAIGMQVHSVGQLRILRLPNPVGASTAAQSTPGRRRHSIPPTQGQGALGSPSLAGGSCSSASANVASTPQMVSTGRSGAGGGPTQLIFACDAGFPHPVSAVAAVGPNSLLVAAGPEIHLVRLEGDSIKFVRTETWRSSIHALASNGRGIMAVASQRGGLELFQFKGDVENEDGLLVRLWGSALPDLVDRLLWCRVDLVAATDRRGMLHFLQLTGDKEPTIRKISHHLPSDIPMTMTLRPTGGDLLVATISGLIYEFPLPSADG